jgi:hypothetical protein
VFTETMAATFMPTPGILLTLTVTSVHWLLAALMSTAAGGADLVDKENETGLRDAGSSDACGERGGVELDEALVSSGTTHIDRW